ncbi:MAG: carboxypeptidase-like regulatory domain-containing protein, partial [Bacteroidota bacterium]|nr:carboxypeptidase-like regulatory domain-containing protein [Bacteroidota bacterium]
MYRNISVLILILWSFSLRAQDQNAVIYGKIVESGTGKALSGALVFIRGTDIGVLAESNGEYILEDIRPGDYTLEVRYLGYETVVQTGVVVAAGERKEITFTLTIQEQAGEVVTIVGDKPLIDVEESGSTSTIDQEKLESQPARQIQEVVGTQPG